jgi:hypothetical protein|tara:strand:+ start:1195 stop:1317 length:123 start_codon:yes stop_codon:yes gene_type:complete
LNKKGNYVTIAILSSSFGKMTKAAGIVKVAGIKQSKLLSR